MQKPTLTLMGTGTSMGVPMVGCDCVVCRSDDPRDRRTRCGVLLRSPDGTAVIDTPPELRLQLIAAGVDVVREALFTHAHADHTVGLDDLRICGLRLGEAIPLHCERPVAEHLRRTFFYAFHPPAADTHPGSVPQFTIREIEPDAGPLSIVGLSVRPLRLFHGRLPVLGFRIGDVAYCTDVSRIPDETWPHLEGLDTLVLDALREEPHPTHFHLNGALEVVERVRPRRTILTHISHLLGHAETSAKLPANVEMGYDGMQIDL